jgi:hypothetical protein
MQQPMASYRVGIKHIAEEIIEYMTKQIKTKKSDRLRLFIFKPEFLKISVDIQTPLAGETHLAELQWPEEQLSMLCSE